ncbi:MAG: sulfatase-like hydrolase/transferase [Planctomycetota bacterium]
MNNNAYLISICRLPSLAFVVILALTTGYPTTGVRAEDTEASSKPNIVLIISDDQAWTDYGFMGHPHVETPHLDALAKRSAVFKRGYVPTALCRPSLATLLTGHYASTHQITGNDPSPKYAAKGSELYQQRCAELIAKSDAFDLLPEVLGREGYLSHQSGKLWEGSYSRCGFTHGMTRGFPEEGGRHGDDGLRIGRDGLKPITDFLDLAQRQRKPFFLWYAPFLPHSPHNPPQRLLDKYTEKVASLSVAKYYAMCEWFDETCGELVGEVDRRGMTENTLFIYVCDNGWIQNPQSSTFAERSKQSANEGGVRTPIMYCWPTRISPQSRPELAISLDIYPTILAAAGFEVPNDLPGLNLMPSLLAGSPVARNHLFGEGFAHDIADLDDPSRTLLYQWVIRDNFKLLLKRDGEMNRYASRHSNSGADVQLYDLSADPTEKHNIAEEMPVLARELASMIDEWDPVDHALASAGAAK